MINLLLSKFLRLRISLALKIIVSIILLMAILMVGLFAINVHKYEGMAIRNAAIQADEIAEVVKAGLRIAMRLDPRQDTDVLMRDIQSLNHIASVAIYDKRGNLSFSGDNSIRSRPLPKGHPLCVMCHAQEPPLAFTNLNDRYVVIEPDNGRRMIRIVSPIPNEAGCVVAGCHIGHQGKPFLGIVEMTVAMDSIEGNLSLLVKDNAQYVLFSLVIIIMILFTITYWLVDTPIRRMIKTTRKIALGDYDARLGLIQNDELGELANAINRMAYEVGRQYEELHNQRVSYQSLFEGVPCLITVQDRDYRLIQFNEAFSERFEAKPGEHCYRAYKGRECKCEVCPVEKTFEDGKSHTTEEIGFYRDGTQAHWIVNTAPVFDENGDIIAAMEMCLDITHRKCLEENLKSSEKKYYAIFNNIPNAVLVLNADTYEIVDSNHTALNLYGYSKGALGRSNYANLVAQDELDNNLEALSQALSLKRTKHVSLTGKTFWASIAVTRSDFDDTAVLLVVVTDISEQIRADEQLVQASKMATLGEMATGVAHELNQPLSVLQMVANMFRRKLKKEKPVDRETLLNMSAKISRNVERATRIISHMREFGRKSDIETELVELNNVIKNAFDFFSQQLRLHDIDVVWDLNSALPPIQADSNRLEQVFINLLLNARDAIMEKCAIQNCGPLDKTITLKTRFTRRNVIAEVIDTGIGISKEIAPRIVEPFFTTKEVGKGTGLGLSISYGIIRDYRGSIRAVPDPDGGARIVVTLPLK